MRMDDTNKVVRPVGRAVSLPRGIAACRAGPHLSTGPGRCDTPWSSARTCDRDGPPAQPGLRLPSIPAGSAGSKIDACDSTCPQRPPCSAGTGWRPMTRCSRRPGAPGRIIARCTSGLVKLGPDELERRHKLADLIDAAAGDHLHGLRPRAGCRADHPVRPDPPAGRRRRLGDDRARLQQRVRALNLFIGDVYHERKVLQDRVVPPELVFGASGYRRQCVGLRVPRDVYIHVSGIDLIRDVDGRFLVLEDNCRTPSGVSYVLKNRQVMKQVFPSLFEQYNVRPVDDYTDNLLALLRSIAPAGCDDPTVVVLTPGVYNSAYYEHSFLARQMGVELVEGRDLVLDRGQIFRRTTRGLQRVDVIYRRIDDDFLDPLTFRTDSLLGVAGSDRRVSRRQRRAGQRARAPASSTTRGSIRSSPTSSAISWARSRSSANVETFRPLVPRTGSTSWRTSASLVVKAVDASGGYGMLIGPASTRRAARRVRPQDRGQPARLHRAADDQPEPAPDLRRRPARWPARRPASVRALRRGDHGACPAG